MFEFHNLKYERTSKIFPLSVGRKTLNDVYLERDPTQPKGLTTAKSSFPEKLNIHLKNPWYKNPEIKENQETGFIRERKTKKLDSRLEEKDVYFGNLNIHLKNP